MLEPRANSLAYTIINGYDTSTFSWQRHTVEDYGDAWVVKVGVALICFVCFPHHKDLNMRMLCLVLTWYSTWCCRQPAGSSAALGMRCMCTANRIAHFVRWGVP